MYATHFNLKGRLVPTGIAQDDTRFADDRGDGEILPVAAGLSTPDAAMVLIGPPGVGKTTTALSALRTTAGGMRSAVAWIGTPPATSHELLELLLAEFGFEPYRQSRSERLQTWRQFLIELDATGTRVFVALERAHELEAALLAALDGLTRADANGSPGANLILMGTDELLELLEGPTLKALRQRVRMVRQVRPLDAAGVAAYLRHAASNAGAELERLFTADAVTTLAQYSDGIPRVLNHLADSSLALAALRRTPLVDAKTVSVVATEIYGFASRPTTETGVEGALLPASPDTFAGSSASTSPIEPHPSSQPASGADEIPVLTDSVDASAAASAVEHGVLDVIESAETLTLIGDADLDELSAEMVAEMLAIEPDAPAADAVGARRGGIEPDGLPAEAAEARRDGIEPRKPAADAAGAQPESTADAAGIKPGAEKSTVDAPPSSEKSTANAADTPPHQAEGDDPAEDMPIPRQGAG